MKALAQKIVFNFALLSIVFIPFPFVFFPYQAMISEGLFGRIIRFFIEIILGIENYHSAIVSDALMMYVLLLLLFMIAVLVSSVVHFFFKNKLPKREIKYILHTVFSYYLALILIKYGTDKLFLGQFYAPEPNILYTPLGYLDRDILFWSTMGTSYAYNVFMGIAEIGAAFLLLFHKTRIVGALFSSAIFINIVAINFSFDISVKLYSSLLLFLSLLILSQFFKQFYHFLLLKQPSQLSDSRPLLFERSFVRTFVKTFIILFILLEAFYPNLQTKQLPFLHGAYQVVSIVQSDKEQNLRSIPFKRIFIHKNHYLIFQDHDDRMSDYKLKIDEINNRLILTDYTLLKDTLNYQYSATDNSLELMRVIEQKQYKINMQQLKHDTLPIIKHHFHWMIDETL